MYLPVWGRQTTTECRLVVTDPFSKREYDNRKYESQMFYFNTVTRVQYYSHDFVVQGFDHCYDCAAEFKILSDYLVKVGKPFTKEDIESMCLKITNFLKTH